MVLTSKCKLSSKPTRWQKIIIGDRNKSRLIKKCQRHRNLEVSGKGMGSLYCRRCQEGMACAKYQEQIKFRKKMGKYNNTQQLTDKQMMVTLNVVSDKKRQAQGEIWEVTEKYVKWQENLEVCRNT